MSIANLEVFVDLEVFPEFARQMPIFPSKIAGFTQDLGIENPERAVLEKLLRLFPRRSRPIVGALSTPPLVAVARMPKSGIDVRTPSPVFQPRIVSRRHRNLEAVRTGDVHWSVPSIRVTATPLVREHPGRGASRIPEGGGTAGDLGRSVRSAAHHARSPIPASIWIVGTDPDVDLDASRHQGHVRSSRRLGARLATEIFEILPRNTRRAGRAARITATLLASRSPCASGPIVRRSFSARLEFR